MIRVIMFEDEPKLIDSLKTYWEDSEEIFLAATFPNANNAASEVKRHKPDVVLMDIQMPGVWGIEAMANIKKAVPDARVLMLTSFHDDDKIFAAICGGASGYVLKGDMDEVEQAIKEVHGGGGHFTPTIAMRVMKMFQAQFVTVQPTYIRLTDREKEVLAAMVKGMSYKMIADALKIKYDTVHDHVKHIYKKLHVNSAPEAVREAIVKKLV